MSISAIIPSRTADNLRVSAGSLQRENARIIVVDDDENGGVKTLCEARTWQRVQGVKPFNFSRNVNLGIRAAGQDDIVILGDDGVLKTRGGFDVLAKAAAEHPEFGVIAAVTNNVGNANQMPKGIGLREDPRIVCFICVFIPRSTINNPKIGLMDEDYQCYSHQDDEYCYQVTKAGLKIGIHDGCFIDHGSLKSTFRSPGGGAELSTGAAIFKRKREAEKAA